MAFAASALDFRAASFSAFAAFAAVAASAASLRAAASALASAACCAAILASSAALAPSAARFFFAAAAEELGPGHECDAVLACGRAMLVVAPLLNVLDDRQRVWRRAAASVLWRLCYCGADCGADCCRTVRRRPLLAARAAGQLWLLLLAVRLVLAFLVRDILDEHTREVDLAGADHLEPNDLLAAHASV